MNDTRPIAAILYDFDKTLSPFDMQSFGFIPALGMTTEEFWKETGILAEGNSMDKILAYMLLMVRKCKEHGIPLTRAYLEELGQGVEFFDGVKEWFSRINAYGDALGLKVEHYIVSSGTREMIMGTPIAKEFEAIYACEFLFDDNGVACWPKMAINYTSKTQYLFRINKGILDVTNDRDLNAFTPEYMRRVPFSNMIYVGDGLTDVPCMKMTKQKGGYSIAVHAPGQTELADDMLLQGRADFSVETDYSEGSDMEKIVTMLMRRIRASHELTLRHAEQVQRAHRRRGKYVPLDIPMRGGLEDGEDVE